MLKSSFQEPFLIGIYRIFVYIKVHMWWMRQSTLIHTLTNTLFNLHTRQQQSSRRYAIFFLKSVTNPTKKKQAKNASAAFGRSAATMVLLQKYTLTKNLQQTV